MIGRDAPYPELKATHTMARVGRPWTDRKPPPSAPIWDVINGFGRFHVLVSAIELGVFDALDVESAAADELAHRLRASAPHLRAVLDALAAMGFVDRVAGRYALNDTSRRYLTTDGAASMAQLVHFAPGPLVNWADLTETVRRGRPPHPIDDDPVAFYAPLVAGTFTTIARAATRADRQLRYSVVPQLRLLDLGAGLAPWTAAILVANPSATAVVNDLAPILDVASDVLADQGLAERVELRPGDYHDITIEVGTYDLAVLGHVCRAESAEGARSLIARAAAALRPGGRVVVSDYFLDRQVDLEPHSAMMNVTMVASTSAGACRTAAEHAGWMRDAGLAEIRLIEPIGFQRLLVGRRP